jgi:hypothetical protein
MNISQLLTTIKMSLGVYGLKLPFENPDEALMDVIKLKSLKTFSIYSPKIETETVDLTKLACKKNDYTESIYVLPMKYPDREIIYIRNVLPRNKLAGNGYMAPIFDGTIQTYFDLAMTQANADLVSVAAPAITFKFEQPNILHLYNFATGFGIVDIEIGYEHSQNLTTIPVTAWESFVELATLDVKAFLYNAMKHYTEIQSAFGTINMKIDEWQNAEDMRRDLVERWKDVYHLETQDAFMII